MTTETPDYVVFRSDLEELAAPVDHAHTASEVGAVPMLADNYASAKGFKTEDDVSKMSFLTSAYGIMWQAYPDKNDSTKMAVLSILPFGDDNESVLPADAITLLASKPGALGLPDMKSVKLYGEHNITSGTTDIGAGSAMTSLIHLVYEE